MDDDFVSILKIKVNRDEHYNAVIEKASGVLRNWGFRATRDNNFLDFRVDWGISAYEADAMEKIIKGLIGLYGSNNCNQSKRAEKETT